MKQLTLFDPIEIPLTKGYIAIVDPIDSDLMSLKWFALIDKSGGAYAAHSIYHPKHDILIHRVIMARILNRELLRNELVDHWDLNPLNNCRSNLRLCSHSQNRCNAKRRANNTSGYKGVSFNKKANKWTAEMKIGPTRLRLGLFITPEEAYEAYRQAAIKYQGEFARVE